jgi:two-component sensor histidine kinase
MAPELLLGEFRHRMGNDLALVVNILERRRSSLNQLTAGEALDDAVDALMALSLL